MNEQPSPEQDPSLSPTVEAEGRPTARRHGRNTGSAISDSSSQQHSAHLRGRSLRTGSAIIVV
jgi:hypothetical protein